MKKIISALTVGAMVATAAFADVASSLSFRQRANLFAHDFNGDEKSSWLSMNKYLGTGSDNLTFNITADVVSFNIGLKTDESKSAAIPGKDLNATVITPIKGLQVFGGLWAEGKVNGAYRGVRPSGPIEGNDFEYKKMGSIFKKSPASFIDNIVNPVTADSEKNFALGAQYKINKNASAQFAYITNTSNKEESKPTAWGMLQGHAFSAHGDFTFEPLKFEVVAKYGAYDGKNTAMALGAYFIPSIPLDGFSTVAGGSFAMVDFTPSDWSADLRLSYKSEGLLISSLHAVSGLIDPKGLEEKTGSKVANEGSKGIAADSSIADGGTAMKRDMIMSNNIAVQYAFNKTFTMTAIFADMIGMGKNMGDDVTGTDNKKDPVEVQLRTSLWGQVKCGASSILTGVVFSIYDVGSNKSKDGQRAAMSIPFIFQCKF